MKKVDPLEKMQLPKLIYKRIGTKESQSWQTDRDTGTWTTQHQEKIVYGHWKLSFVQIPNSKFNVLNKRYMSPKSNHSLRTLYCLLQLRAATFEHFLFKWAIGFYKQKQKIITEKEGGDPKEVNSCRHKRNILGIGN